MKDQAVNGKTTKSKPTTKKVFSRCVLGCGLPKFQENYKQTKKVIKFIKGLEGNMSIEKLEKITCLKYCSYLFLWYVVRNQDNFIACGIK